MVSIGYGVYAVIDFCVVLKDINVTKIWMKNVFLFCEVIFDILHLETKQGMSYVIENS